MTESFRGDEEEFTLDTIYDREPVELLNDGLMGSGRSASE